MNKVAMQVNLLATRFGGDLLGIKNLLEKTRKRVE